MAARAPCTAARGPEREKRRKPREISANRGESARKRKPPRGGAAVGISKARSVPRAEEPVARIAETRNDIRMIVQMRIQRRDVELHVRMGVLEHLHALGRGHQ